MKDIDIKKPHILFFDDIINIKNFGSNKVKIDRNPYKNILILYIRYVTIKDSKYPLYFMINKVNGYFEEINGNKYLTLVPTNENKEIIKKFEELWSKIGDLIRSVTTILDGFDEKCLKIKFNSHMLPLNVTI